VTVCFLAGEDEPLVSEAGQPGTVVVVIEEPEIVLLVVLVYVPSKGPSADLVVTVS
jgi:hypothetical protein